MPRRLQQNTPEKHKRKTLVNNDHIWGALFVVLFLSSAFFVKGLWVFVWRCFGGPLGAPRVSSDLPWGPPAHGQGHPEGATVPACFVVFGVSLGSFGVLSGVSHAFLLSHSLDKLEVGLRSCTARFSGVLAPPGFQN